MRERPVPNGPANEDRLVEVALPLAVHNPFTYGLPGPLPPPGARVVVPFRRGALVGWALGARRDNPAASWAGSIRRVLAVIDGDRPALTSEVLELCRWMSKYYVAPLGACLRTALPAALSDSSCDFVVLSGKPDARLTPREARLVGALLGSTGPVPVRKLARGLGRSVWPEVRSLAERGIVAHQTVPPPDPLPRTSKVVVVTAFLGTLTARDRRFGRARRQRELYERLEAQGGRARLKAVTRDWGFSRSVVAGLESKELAQVIELEDSPDPFAEAAPEPHPKLRPTADQARAIARITEALSGGAKRPFLLHGVTGSGKTFVYLEVIRAALARGLSAIVLVPQIALTPQTARRFRSHFGDEVAVLHSRLSEGERYKAWLQLREGERRIAVGARSAIFAPVSKLGVVVVDEEHDGSYKHGETPRYLARDLAVVRARLAGGVCVLGSATPSLESWRNASTGKYARLDLPERVGGGRLPQVSVVDLREEKPGVFSPQLATAIENRLGRGEQCILLLNRRGYSSFVQCLECGEVEVCPNCSISMTFHRREGAVTCHHCGHSAPSPRSCSRCGSEGLSFRGLGTEQVERIAHERFPSARIARMDLDTTSGKWAHRDILDRMASGAIDILLGTQMIAKGHDFHRVTLVGVINADVGMHLPDFRATERSFQLVSQVSGRAGRGRLSGRVVVQTRMPDHYAIVAAARHDYAAFAERELAARKLPAYPPFVRLAKAVISSPDRNLAAETASRAALWVQDRVRRRSDPVPGPVEILGPAPAPIERLRRRWRWHFLARSASPGAVGAVCRALVREFSLPSGDLRLVVDRDPTALL